jgi:hypothetical protein
MLYSSLSIVLASLFATPLSASHSPPPDSNGPLQTVVESPFHLTEPQVRYVALWEEFSFTLAECLCEEYRTVTPAPHPFSLPSCLLFYFFGKFLSNPH